MPVNLRGRHFLTLKDFSADEIRYLLDLSRDLKNKKRAGIRGNLLDGRNIVLIFEKTSTRTRAAFETAAFDEGGRVTFLTNSQMGKKESIEDTAIVLGRYYDGIEFRGFKQETCDELARYAGVPVWNGLTDKYHPTQVLADLMTIEEHVAKPLHQVKFVYVGDARNNMGNSLMIGAAKMGIQFTAVAPKSLFPAPDLVEEMKMVASATGGSITLTDDIAAGVKDADALYTDVWCPWVRKISSKSGSSSWNPIGWT
jgi:ornithine carbamoyltransferase